MAMQGGVGRLSAAIAEAVRMAKRGRPAERGRVSSGGVQIGTRVYPCKLAVDLNIREGDVVWCQVTDDGSLAVIVGA